MKANRKQSLYDEGVSVDVLLYGLLQVYKTKFYTLFGLYFFAGSPYLDLHDLERTAGKKLVAEQIVCRGDSAAAVICRLFQSVTYKEKGIDFADKVLGVVALLGMVQTHDLSRYTLVFSLYSPHLVDQNQKARFSV